MKTSGIMLGSDQPDVLGAFYTAVLGKPGWQEDSWYGFGVAASSLMIGPHSEVNGKSKEPARIMIVINSEDVPKDFEKIAAITGASIIAKPYLPRGEAYPDMWLATLADPDGNYIQLSSPWDEADMGA